MVDSSLKAEVVPRLEDEGHWKQCTFPRTRKLELSHGSNFRCKLKEKGHVGRLIILKWSYPNGLYLDYSVVIEFLFVNILLQVHVLIFSIFLIFGPFFTSFWQKSPSFALSF
jgi:hypothetical protein